VTPDEEREKLMKGLVADRTNAVHTDEVLRATDPDKPVPISPGVISLDFPADSTKVEADAQAKLSTLAALQKEGGGHIRIVGHSGDEPVKAKDDAARKLEYFDLSMRRAQAVSAELLRLGVPGDALIVEARGDDDGPAHKVDVSLQ
jgi:outer membrane protein OmpA-like peptidoglycan-associated protein